ncbi:MAG: hypothetical protein HOP30_05985 [Cyclobacteriaceae bacterium]|nr:hypothetical protein [Cyclobacteriaceae bacterium]
MSNTELIDDYLTNRLSDADKAAFESQLANDPALQADVALQGQIIESVRKARAIELKAMLNQVPVTAPVSITLPIMRMAASIVGAGIIILAFSYYFNNSTQQPNMSSSLEESLQKVDPADFEPLEEPTAQPTPTTEEKVAAPASTTEKEIKKETPRTSPVQQPKIDVVDPTKDMTDGGNAALPKNETSHAAITASHIAVEVEDNNKKYPFHYQFNQGKLFLYGSFDKGLYEILEINGDAHSVFLFYKDNYYSLDEKVSAITALEPIRNQALISKLKEYKSR